MKHLTPFGLMLIGFMLLIAGFAVPFLMVIQVLEASFLGAFLSYIASMGGLIIGVIGTAIYARERQH